MNGRTSTLCAVLIAVSALALLAYLQLRNKAGTPHAKRALATVQPPHVPSPVAAPVPPRRVISPSSVRGADALELTSPAATVTTQIALLQANRGSDFRSTFLPSVQREVSDAALVACKRRVQSAAVLPDWEMAENSVVDGHRVQKVSMFGKSMTGFHEVSAGRWLADALWCLPVY